MKQFNPCKVTERRKKLQKTQSDVAKEAGLSLASLSYIETGKKIPKANTLIRLADALKCSVDTGDITIVLYLTEVLYEKQRDKGCRPVAQSHIALSLPLTSGIPVWTYPSNHLFSKNILWGFCKTSLDF